MWDVQPDYSCAYRAQGNGLVERIHRTIKRMVARSCRGVAEMVFWYNCTKGERPASPSEFVFGAKPRMPGITSRRRPVQADLKLRQIESSDTRARPELNPFAEGDLVFVKRTSRCDQPWSGPHRISRVVSSVAVTLDGDSCPRHVSHLRRVPLTDAIGEVRQPPVEPAKFRAACDEQSTDEDNSSDVDEHEETLTSASCQPDVAVVGVAPEPVDDGARPAATTRDRRPPSWMADYYEL